MRILSYNYCGLGTPEAVNSFRTLVRRWSLDLVFLIETKLYATEMRVVKWKCNLEGCFVVHPKKRPGGLALLWREGVNVPVQSYTAHHVDAEVMFDRMKFRVMGMHGWPEGHMKKYIWDLVDHLGNGNTLPWFVFGDFIGVLFPSKKEGGNGFDFQVASDFMAVLDRKDLHDIGYNGYRFTWSNGREYKEHIEERLDRFLCNDEWSLLWATSGVTNIIWKGFDHYPIMLDTAPARRKTEEKDHVVKFEVVWTKEHTFRDVVLDTFRETAGVYESISDRLVTCGEVFSAWGEDKLGNLASKVKIYINAFKSCVRLISKRPLNSMRFFWAQRAYHAAIKEGGQNTGFFHA